MTVQEYSEQLWEREKTKRMSYCSIGLGTGTGDSEAQKDYRWGGNKMHAPSETQKAKHGKSVRSTITATHFICGRYVVAGSKSNYAQRSFYCLNC